MKKFMLAACALAVVAVSAKTLVVHLTSGETQKYEVSEISKLSFEESATPEILVSLDEFTDPEVRAAVAAADADEDGMLSTSELATITELNLASKNVASLDGLKYLTELTDLNVMSSKLTAIDLTGIAEKLEFLQCGFSSDLTSLTLGNKPALTEVYAMYCALTDIDLTGTPALESITVQNCNIENVKATDLKSLKSFTAGGETIKTADLSGCDALTKIAFYSAEKMTGFDISGFPALEEFTFEGSKVERIETTNNPKLVTMNLNSNGNLNYIDVSKSRKLNTISCYACYALSEGEGNVILSEGQNIPNMYGIYSWNIARVPFEWPADITVEFADEAFKAAMLEIADTDKDGKIGKEEALAVTEIKLPNAGLKSVNLDYFNNVTVLDLSGNELTAIDMAGAPLLADINLENNKIAGKLDVSKLEHVEKLNASHNELTGISSFGQRGPVKEINLSYNKMASVELKFFNNCTNINVSHNELTYAMIASNNALSDLDVSFNKITEMTLWSLTGLKRVNFNDNPFIQLNESTNWTLLQEIDFSNTDIEMIDLSKTSTLWTVKATGCKNLKTIYVGDNGDAEIYKDSDTKVVYGSPE